MEDFLRFFDQEIRINPMRISITHSSITDWTIDVQTGRNSFCKGERVCLIQDGDIELAFARAHVTVKEWLLEHRGGY